MASVGIASTVHGFLLLRGVVLHLSWRLRCCNCNAEALRNPAR
jgi:hypothetical protein